jgi:hypothetical protein
MWFILGGEQTEAICIQDLSVFILAIFGLGLNCIIEDSPEEEMFDDSEVKEIQTAFEPFFQNKLSREQSLEDSRIRVQDCGRESQRYVPQEQEVEENQYFENNMFNEGSMIQEEQEEEDREDKSKRNTREELETETVMNQTSLSRGGRGTAKSRHNDTASMKKRQGPKSVHSTSSSPMLLLDVNLGGGKMQRVMMHESDDPNEVADKIIRENGLDESLKAKFLKILEEQLSN